MCQAPHALQTIPSAHWAAHHGGNAPPATHQPDALTILIEQLENSLSPDFDGDGIPDCQDSDIDNDQVPDIIDPNSYKYDEFLVSEFISDNGDGINDVFNIVKITNYPNSSLVIYSRSGVEIYNKRNYQNTWPLDQDQKVPEGSYFYFLDLENDGLIDKRGWIYLTR